jgi:hypothetical protein
MNALRGEVAIMLGGETQNLVLTLGALALLEEASRDGLLGLAERLSAGRLSVGDAIFVLAAGCHGAGRPIEAAELGRMIPASDLELALNTAAALLAASFGGGSSSRPPPPQAGN